MTQTQTKQCQVCAKSKTKRKLWECGNCGAKCCAHMCRNKNSVTNLATCGKCMTLPSGWGF